MTGEYGVAVVNAMQETDAAGHPRVNSYLKHFTAYSTETNRMHSDYNVTVRFACLRSRRLETAADICCVPCARVVCVQLFDFYDTYLPQYKRVFTEGENAAPVASAARASTTPC